MEYTLSIIKPDILERNLTGVVNSYLEKAGLKIVAQKMMQLTNKQVQAFYKEHSARPFFQELVDNMTTGPVIVQVLKGANAVQVNRTIMGATDFTKADAGTIRKDFAKSIGENSVHGSDSLESAKREISFFFAESEIIE